MQDHHQPVLLEEVLAHLAVQSSSIIVDATAGRGGHAQRILAQLGNSGRLLLLDQDPQAITYVRARFQDPRVVIEQGSFAMLENAVNQQGWLGAVDAVLLDLGVSSPQLDDPARGFSFRHDGPLDMRMNPQAGLSAAQWLAQATEADISDVLKTYGEERFAKRIARAIVAARAQAAITQTRQLAEIIKVAHPRWEIGKHPATRSFQAIRIFINRELWALEQVLAQMAKILTVGGRLLVISFHSLEDRVVKHFIQGAPEDLPRGLPVRTTVARQFKKIGGPIKPTASEIELNPRARSAVLRIAEKIA